MSSSTRHFVRHYIEMVIAMFVGMAVLYLPADTVPALDLWDEAPALMLGWMGLSMTVPMVGWMRHRGHTWRPCWEMAASMILPTLGTIALLATGAVSDAMDLMGVLHIAMFPAMLVAMLLRPSEYTGHHGHHGAPQEAAA